MVRSTCCLPGGQATYQLCLLGKTADIYPTPPPVLPIFHRSLAEYRVTRVELHFPSLLCSLLHPAADIPTDRMQGKGRYNFHITRSKQKGLPFASAPFCFL